MGEWHELVLHVVAYGGAVHKGDSRDLSLEGERIDHQREEYSGHPLDEATVARQLRLQLFASFALCRQQAGVGDNGAQSFDKNRQSGKTGL